MYKPNKILKYKNGPFLTKEEVASQIGPEIYGQIYSALLEDSHEWLNARSHDDYEPMYPDVARDILDEKNVAIGAITDEQLQIICDEVTEAAIQDFVERQYDAAEAATYELCTLVAFIKCTDTSYCLNTAYTEANVTGVPGRFREISSLIKKGEQNKALSRIDSLYNDIWEAHQHISQAGFAKNEEFVAQLFESGMKFLDAECENLGGKCNYPDPIPHEPKSPICTGTGLLSIMIVLGILIHWKRH